MHDPNTTIPLPSIYLEYCHTNLDPSFSRQMHRVSSSTPLSWDGFAVYGACVSGETTSTASSTTVYVHTNSMLAAVFLR